MTRARLTPEQRRLIEQAGDEPVRLDDPETHQAYVLVREDLYRRLRGVIEAEPARGSPGGPGTEPLFEVPEGLRRSKEAFRRALPGLLADRRLRGWWVAYHGDERVGVARKPETLTRQCVQRGLTHVQYHVGCIRPHADEPEEIDPSLFEYDEFRPPS